MTDETPTTSVHADWYRSFVPRDPDGCWYYASLPAERPPGGRFDLKKPMGTCYWGESVEVAFRERIRRSGSQANSVPASLLGFVVTCRPVRADDLVDLTHKDATKTTGVTGDVLAGRDYAASRSLAEQWSAGYGGVHYNSRFALNHRAAALFGECGEHAPRGDRELARLSGEEAAALLGIRVLPRRPRRGSVPIKK